jgi:hypothetical protein
MPSKVHDGLVHLLHQRPALAPDLLADGLRLPLPAYTTARLASADLTQISSTEFRADAVITLETPGAPEQTMTIITEVQRRPTTTSVSAGRCT